MSPARRGPDFTRHVLQDSSRTTEVASWELLRAIEDMFPLRCKQLRSIGEERDNYDEDDSEADERFLQQVSEWTAANRISSDAVDEAATKYAVGEGPAAGVFLDAHFDEGGNLVFHDTPRISAEPYEETREEFLKRAAEHYDQLAERYRTRDGATRGPILRETHHFRYLAAHLVGQLSFEDIRRKCDTLKVPAASPKTIAGQARIAARLVGIGLRAARGPRPGSRTGRAVHRARR